LPTPAKYFLRIRIVTDLGRETPKFRLPFHLLSRGLNQGSESKPGKNRVFVAVAIIALVVFTGTYFGEVYLSQSSCPGGSSVQSFAIIVDDETGYNHSMTNSGRGIPFYSIGAQKGDCVQIRLINESPNQSHGLAVDYYQPNGIVAKAGETVLIRFQATKVGQFNIFEQILSTIPPGDTQGALYVAQQ
jgi:hypothetical protein